MNPYTQCITARHFDQLTQPNENGIYIKYIWLKNLIKLTI